MPTSDCLEAFARVLVNCFRATLMGCSPNLYSFNRGLFVFQRHFRRLRGCWFQPTIPGHVRIGSIDLTRFIPARAKRSKAASA
jgi:hypothetical protein